MHLLQCKTEKGKNIYFLRDLYLFIEVMHQNNVNNQYKCYEIQKWQIFQQF